MENYFEVNLPNTKYISFKWKVFTLDDNNYPCLVSDNGNGFEFANEFDSELDAVKCIPELRNIIGDDVQIVILKVF